MTTPSPIHLTLPNQSAIIDVDAPRVFISCLQCLTEGRIYTFRVHPSQFDVFVEFGDDLQCKEGALSNRRVLHLWRGEVETVTVQWSGLWHYVPHLALSPRACTVFRASSLTANPAAANPAEQPAHFTGRRIRVIELPITSGVVSVDQPVILVHHKEIPGSTFTFRLPKTGHEEGALLYFGNPVLAGKNRPQTLLHLFDEPITVRWTEHHLEGGRYVGQWEQVEGEVVAEPVRVSTLVCPTKGAGLVSREDAEAHVRARLERAGKKRRAQRTAPQAVLPNTSAIIRLDVPEVMLLAPIEPRGEVAYGILAAGPDGGERRRVFIPMMGSFQTIETGKHVSIRWNGKEWIRISGNPWLPFGAVNASTLIEGTRLARGQLENMRLDEFEPGQGKALLHRATQLGATLPADVALAARADMARQNLDTYSKKAADFAEGARITNMTVKSGAQPADLQVHYEDSDSIVVSAPLADGRREAIERVERILEKKIEANTVGTIAGTPVVCHPQLSGLYGIGKYWAGWQPRRLWANGEEYTPPPPEAHVPFSVLLSSWESRHSSVYVECGKGSGVEIAIALRAAIADAFRLAWLKAEGKTRRFSKEAWGRAGAALQESQPSSFVEPERDKAGYVTGYRISIDALLERLLGRLPEALASVEPVFEKALEEPPKLVSRLMEKKERSGRR